MLVSTRGRYALRIMMELAQYDRNRWIPLPLIAEKQEVSEKYLDVIHAKTDIFLVLAFLFPFFPDDVLCILAGLTQISFRRFAGIILCTRPWGLLFASALGGASFSIPAWGMALIGAAGLLLFLLGMKYGDRAEAAILRRLRRNSHS